MMSESMPNVPNCIAHQEKNVLCHCCDENVAQIQKKGSFHRYVEVFPPPITLFPSWSMFIQSFFSGPPENPCPSNRALQDFNSFLTSSIVACRVGAHFLPTHLARKRHFMGKNCSCTLYHQFKCSRNNIKILTMMFGDNEDKKGPL